MSMAGDERMESLIQEAYEQIPGHDKVLLNRDERRFIEQPRGMKKVKGK